MSDSYSRDAHSLIEALPDFVPGQGATAARLADLIKENIDSHGLRTIVDLGCGSGEVITQVAHLLEPTARLRFIGVDISEEMIRKASNRGSSVEFMQIDARCDLGEVFERVFVTQETADDERENTAIICSGHTIFHLPYLEELLEGYRTKPSQRPALWIVDIHDNWNTALDATRQGERHYEPRAYYPPERGGPSTLLLFTERAIEGRVRRGLTLDKGDGPSAAPVIVTEQLGWSADELASAFGRAGYMVEKRIKGPSGWGPMESWVFATPRKSVSVPELLWGPRFETVWSRKLGADHESPLDFIREWIAHSQALSEGGISNMLVELVPYFHESAARRELQQEMLFVRPHGDQAGLLDPGELFGVYDAIAKSLQSQDLGLYLHDHQTGYDASDGALAGWTATTRASHCRADGTIQTLRGDAAMEWMAAQLQGISSEPELAGAPIKVPHPDIECWQRSIAIGALGAATTKEGLSRARNRAHRLDLEGLSPSSALGEDYTRLLDLFHSALRRGLNLGQARRTVLLSAPLRVTHSKGGKRRDALDVPRSYRGSVWIFAVMEDGYRQETTKVLRELVKVSLLEGTAAIENVAANALAARLANEARRTASIAIMGRNLSHNIGSHVISSVISQTKNDMENLKRKPKAFQGECGGLEVRNLTTSDWTVFQHHLLLRYLQERMDFLAEVSTSSSYISLPLSLRTVLEDFERQYLLTTFISGIQSDGDGGGQDERIRGHVKLLDRETESASDRPTAVGPPVGTLHDVLIAFPGGRNGAQALFTIMENMIRNCAKHRPYQARNSDVCISLDYLEMGEKVRIRAWDNGGNALAQDEQGGTLIDRLNGVIQTGSILDEEGRLRRGNWGVREMMIAAAYLRGLPLEQVDDDPDEDAPLLRVLAVDSRGRPEVGPGSSLCYEFFVLVPRLVAIVDDDLFSKIGSERRDGLRSSGVAIAANAAFAGRETSPYRYLVAHESPASSTTTAAWMQPDQALRNLVACTGDATVAGRDIWAWAACRWKDQLAHRHGCMSAKLHIDAKGSRRSDDLPGGSLAFIRHGRAPAGGWSEEPLFWESFDQADDQFSLLESVADSDCDALANEFMAAALSRIIVLDERVQNAAGDQARVASGTLSAKDGLRLRRIIVPETAGLALDRSIDWDKLEQYLDSCAIDPVDFVVVHLGILERAVASTPAKAAERMDAMGWRKALCRLRAWAALQRPAPEIVICSGRGTNEVASAEVRFVPASQVERWAVRAPSKYHLYQLLIASRSPRQDW